MTTSPDTLMACDRCQPLYAAELAGAIDLLDVAYATHLTRFYGRWHRLGHVTLSDSSPMIRCLRDHGPACKACA